MSEMTKEDRRLREADSGGAPWRRWGPYLSERQWGTVREDYSEHGNAWEYFPHDHARSRAYRWGEDGLAGISDEQQRLCVALALWNGRDPILKERLFGLTNGEGNHGEDVKELYYYLDATPSHSYLKMLYKYPQAEFPYGQLVDENRRRGIAADEYELLDTGVFEEDRYWDVEVEYAKPDAETVLMQITAHNRGPDESTLHILPTVWFRNTWSWEAGNPKPQLQETGPGRVRAEEAELGRYEIEFGPGAIGAASTRRQKPIRPEILWTENETNTRRLYGNATASGPFKDGIQDRVVRGDLQAVASNGRGTKTAGWYVLTVPAGASARIVVRMSRLPDGKAEGVGSNGSAADWSQEVARAASEAEEYYSVMQRDVQDPELRRIQRQAFAGMIWSKQYFHYDVRQWLAGDPAQPSPPRSRTMGRNREWDHLNASEILSMPDKWEYPWFAAWDLAFHCLPLAQVDAAFAKSQLLVLTREWYMHPNGQLPAYEWAFGDVNPPVHAWATWRVFQIDRKQRRLRGSPEDPGDLEFLERVFHKLLLNFTWWVNRKDTQGRNIFQGGFLGLDNIGVFDRSAPLPTGGFINQADGTSWMAMYCLNLLRISLELARSRRAYEDIATKFFEHFLHIAAAINGVGEGSLGLWDEQDKFYYDMLCLPDGSHQPMKLRSMVGLIPFFAVEVIEPELLRELPEFAERMKWFLENRPDLAALVSRWSECGEGDRHLLSLLRGHRVKRLLHRMLDETEFLSEYGVRALSKAHEREPYRLKVGGAVHEVQYWPGESRSGVFGGNSNWRGPIWMPVNYLLIESLQRFHHYYGDDFLVECPTGSGRKCTLKDAADEVSRRLIRIFLPGPDGLRPFASGHPKQATDPHFKDHLQFHEYFHGDTGRGIGASHQTGWTGLVAKLIQPRREGSGTPMTPERDSDEIQRFRRRATKLSTLEDRNSTETVKP